VDAVLPTSLVAGLPAVTTASTVTLSWSGSDDSAGSGIAGYDVYVSDNGGAFTPLVKATTQTSTTFTGQAGHHHALYSLPTDTGKAQFQLYPGKAHLQGKGYTVDVGAMKTINATGGATGSVTLYDSKANDTFVGTPKTASLTGGGFRSVASGFGKVTVNATA